MSELSDIRERIVALEEQGKAHKEASEARHAETRENFREIFNRLNKLPCDKHTDVNKQISILQWAVGILIVVIGWLGITKS